MSFGVSVGAPFPYGFPDLRQICKDVGEIEAMGCDTLRARDHVVTHRPVHDLFVLLGVFAARLSRILLGLGVLLLPLRHPTLMA